MHKIATHLLDWYDIHARDLPWRVAPDQIAQAMKPDPYAVWLSEIMLQQTTVAAVRDYFVKFRTMWPTVSDLAHARDQDVMAAWAGLGYYARARNLLKCARIIHTQHGGTFPNTQAELIKLPGIGPYTSAAIASIAFDEPAVVVDGNVERVMARVFDDHTPLPAAKPRFTELAASLTPSKRPGDYAQSVMDLGATICTPKSPACGICPLVNDCAAHAAGTATALPKKSPKPVKPTRFGHVFVVQNTAGDVCLETRPPKGLLGGMLGFLGSDWSEIQPDFRPPWQATWQTHNTEVRHTFTHFHLRLTVHVATCETIPATFEFTPKAAFDPDALPTVMRKVWHIADKGWTE